MLSLTPHHGVCNVPVGYNVLFGYTGLLSLGHAPVFRDRAVCGWATDLLFRLHVDIGVLFGVVVSALVSLVVGAVALRTAGVSFMIVTLMFAQVGYLLTSYFIEYTQGDAGLSLTGSRRIELLGFRLDLGEPHVRLQSRPAIPVVGIVLSLLAGSTTGWTRSRSDTRE